MSYLCADLTDVTLANEDTNSIPADNAKEEPKKESKFDRHKMFFRNFIE